MGEWEFFIQDDMMRNRATVYLSRYMGDSKREFVCGDGALKLLDETGPVDDKEDYSFGSFTSQQLQALADGLAREGLKTTNDAKNEGLLEATNKHLEDMRSLVFKKPKA